MNVAFVVDRFPAISETFILNQMTGLIDLAHDITIFPTYGRGDPTEPMHTDVSKYGLLDRIVDPVPLPACRWKRIVPVLRIMGRFWHRDPLHLLASLNPLRTGRSALSLAAPIHVAPFLGRRFDVIHCHFGTNGYRAVMLRKARYRVPIVVMFHGYDIRLGLTREGGVYSDLFATADAILAISEYGLHKLLDLGAPSSKLVRHPVGIDLRRFCSKVATATHPSACRILSVGRLVEDKGYSVALEAIGLLRQRMPSVNISYTIIGAGPLESRLKEQTKALGVAETVHFRGEATQEEVLAAMHASDIFFLPSVNENLPVSLMEAHATGLPAVAADVGGVKEILLDGKSGFLCSPSQPESCADKLAQLLRNPHQWVAMGLAGRRHVESEYDILALNKKLVRLFEFLVDSFRSSTVREPSAK